MKSEDLKKLVDGKRRWSEPLTAEDRAKGFKGWYSSKYLPHFDSPGTQQYITYRLADSLPDERRGEWEARRVLLPRPSRIPLPTGSHISSDMGNHFTTVGDETSPPLAKLCRLAVAVGRLVPCSNFI